jgi:hypothetical protein
MTDVILFPIGNQVTTVPHPVRRDGFSQLTCQTVTMNPDHPVICRQLPQG